MYRPKDIEALMNVEMDNAINDTKTRAYQEMETFVVMSLHANKPLKEVTEDIELVDNMKLQLVGYKSIVMYLLNQREK